jgi:hypothetical protein
VIHDQTNLGEPESQAVVEERYKTQLQGSILALRCAKVGCHTPPPGVSPPASPMTGSSEISSTLRPLD